MPPTATAVSLADQVLAQAPYVNLCDERLDDRSLRLLTPREAWEHLVLPLRDEEGTQVFATTVETLPSALELVQKKTDTPFRFVLTEIRQLEQFVAERYHFEGIDVDDERVEFTD